MSLPVAPFGTARLAAVLALVLTLLALLAGPASATEGEAVAPAEDNQHLTIDDIGSNNEVSNKYKPEAAEAPPFMRFFYLPLVIGGFLIVGALLMMYLAWQPRFAEERRSKRRR